MADYLYVATRSSGFYIIDWTDVTNMSHVGWGTAFGWGVTGVFEYEDTVYCGAYKAEHARTDTFGGMASIFDISDPTSPVAVNLPILLNDYLAGANYDMIICAVYVFTASNGYKYLCVIDRQTAAGMRVLNINDPTNPYMVAYFGGDTEGGMFTNAAVNNGMYFDGNYLYVTDWSGLHTFDFTDSESPVYIGATGTGCDGIAVSGTTLFTGRSGSPYGFSVFDISTPGSPTFVINHPASDIGMNSGSGEYGVEFAIEGTTLAVATRPDAISNIHTYDISDINNPTHLGSINLRALFSPPSTPVTAGMVMKDGYIVHGGGDVGLVIIDASTMTTAPFSPYIGSMNLSNPYRITYDLYWPGPSVPEGPGAKVSSIIDLYTGSSGIMHVARRAPTLVQEAMSDDTSPRIYDITPRPYARLSDQVSTITFHVQDDETPVLDETLIVSISGTMYVVNGTAVNGALIGVSQDAWGGKTYSVTLPAGVQTPVSVSVSIRNGAGLEAQRTWWYGAMTHGPYTSIDLSYTVVDDVMAVTDVTLVIINGKGVIDPDSI